MEVDKKKWEALKARAKNKGKAAMSSGKDVAMAVGAGAVGYYAHREGATRVEFIRDNWYSPLLFAGIGWALRRKAPFAAGALCGVAGYATAMGYEFHKESEKHQPATAQGYGDAGAYRVQAFEPVSAEVQALPAGQPAAGGDFVELDSVAAQALGL